MPVWFQVNAPRPATVSALCTLSPKPLDFIRKPMAQALVIVPTYNERANLPTLLDRLAHVNPRLDLLIVDDHSPDGTGRLADEFAAHHPWVHVLHRDGPKGLGRAYCAGFAWALAQGYDYICEMDGDLSHDPSDLPLLVAAAETADLAIGSRYAGGIRVINWPLHRLLLSAGAARYVRAVTGMPVADPTGGFKCFRRSTLAGLNLSAIGSNGYGFQIEVNHLVWRCGGRIVEVPIVFTERKEGHSKMSGRIVFEAVWLVWRLAWENRFRRRPRHRP